jgi:hypothetical protein
MPDDRNENLQKGESISHADNAVYHNIRTTLVNARQKVYAAVNFAMVEAYWEIGRQIMEAQDNNPRAEYRAGLITFLAERLTGEFGKGFDESSLRRMRQFHQVFPIRATLSHELSWSHYRLLMKRAKINQDLIETYHGVESLPFTVKENARVAVKIVDNRGIESLKVIPVGKDNGEKDRT